MFRLGYNTNGFAHHRPEDALRVLAELGYEAVAVTPDVGPLDPLAPDAATVERVAGLARELGLSLVVETGARFVLDPRTKHFPTLLEDAASDRERRVDFLAASVALAQRLGADVVSLWSGRAPSGVTGDDTRGAEADALFERLAEGLRPVLATGASYGVRIGFEPEPGMFVERPAGYERLLETLGPDGEALGLTLDVGHCVCTGDVPVAAVIREHAARLVNVQLDDMRASDHTHLMFGEGELDLPATLAALVEVGFSGVAAVELSRDSHHAPTAAATALERLRAALGGS
ncbi:MAG: sugar phosphate isomerase/epimerase [Planctomycetota bacterium]